MEGIFHLRLLGPVQVERNGEPVADLKSRKALALLGYLAGLGQPVSREHLADLFWGDKTEARGRANLSWTLNRISAQLPDCLRTDRHTVQFQQPASFWLDLNAFAEFQVQGQATSLAAAVELYRGEFLEGVYLHGCAEFEMWLVKERERWRQRVAQVLGELVTYHSQRGEYKPGLSYAQRLLGLEPWREETHRQVMRLLAYSGQRSAALAQYEACCRVMAEELDVEPAVETTKLYEQIRDGKLEFPVSSFERLPDLPAQPPSFLDKDTGETVERAVFVARHYEVARLDGFLEQALAGQGRVVFVTGEAGQGKTALLQEFARRAQLAHSNLIVASGNGNAYTGIGDPYLPFREILSLLAGDVEARWTAGVMTREQARRLWRLLPLTVQALLEVGPKLLELFVPGAALIKRAMTFTPWPGETSSLSQLEELVERQATIPGDPALQQSALFEQYTRLLGILARQYPLLLILDDLQWVDSGSTNLLFQLGRQIGGDRILIVGAFRPAEVTLGRGEERHPLEPVVNEFKRYFGDIVVDLEQAEDRQFVDALLDTEPNRLGDAFRRTLCGQTRGHPLFTVELLRGMRERGDLIQDQQGRWVEEPTLDWDRLPARVEAVIAERIGRLPEELRDTLTVASVEGETFIAEVVARVGATDVREMVERLSGELDRRHRLVRAQGILRIDGQRLSQYRFRHILFQKYHYNTLDPVERAHLHQAVGTALEALYAEGEEDIPAIVSQLARHFQEAGIAEKAIDYLCQAGDRARGLYAHEEAIDYYQRALALLKEQGDAGRERAARTLMKLGLTYHIAFDFRQAHQAYEEGFALWQRAGEMVPAVPTPAPHALRVSWLDPPTLDPTMAWDTTSTMVIDLLFNGLLELSPEMEVVPNVAQSWEVLEDGRKYIFQLRNDFQWSDGTLVTAGDFEFAWKRVLDPATESPNASKLFDLKRARAFHRGEMSDPNQVGVQALDALTLAVELEEPTGYFLHLLAHYMGYPIPQHVVAEYGEAWAEPENIVTNGPFRLEIWSQDESLVLSRHTEYHGRFRGNLQRVELTLLSDWNTRFEMYKADDLDIFELWRSRSPEEMAAARHQHTGDYVTGPSLVTMYVGFDVSRPPFDDARVRRAFVHAVDRETLAGVLMRGYVFPATGGFVPPGMPGHSAGIGLPYDPDQAQHLLVEAGYPQGTDYNFPRLELLTFHGGESRAEYLQAQWRENLGIEITLQSVEFGLLLEKLDSQSPPMFLIGWGADYPDPDDFLRVCPARRWTGWQNEAYTGLVEKAKRVTKQEERMHLYQKADQILVEAAAIMPLTYGRQHWLVKPWVRKFLTPAMYTSCFWKDVIIEAH